MLVFREWLPLGGRSHTSSCLHQRADCGTEGRNPFFELAELVFRLGGEKGCALLFRMLVEDGFDDGGGKVVVEGGYKYK